MGSVRTPILGRPRPLARQRHADRLYTLICEEPHWVRRVTGALETRDRGAVDYFNIAGPVQYDKLTPIQHMP